MLMLADVARMLRTIRKGSTRSALRSANGGDVDIDSLNILGLEESPAKLEAVITEQQSLAQSDESVGALLTITLFPSTQIPNAELISGPW